jgi:CubicO group peptidase (beta-lactamase class C family)
MRLLFLVWTLASVVAWPPANVRADEVDDYAKAAIERHHIPGLGIAVIKDGRLLFERHYGLANLETNTPVTKDSVFRFQSISKQFAVAATMRLVEQGQIRLEEDNVSKYFDELVTSGKVVKPETLRLIQSEAKLTSGDRAEVKLANPRLLPKTSYGLGHFIGDYRGHRVVWTPGAGSGFSTSLTRFPEDGVSVIVFSNLNSFLLADELARGIGERVIPGLKATEGK